MYSCSACGGQDCGGEQLSQDAGPGLQVTTLPKHDL
jgi:hypothetical protein